LGLGRSEGRGESHFLQVALKELVKTGKPQLGVGVSRGSELGLGGVPGADK